MSDFREITHETVSADLRAFADYLEKRGGEAERTDVAEHLNRQLDDLHNCDSFGTEGQLDPRGDHRG